MSHPSGPAGPGPGGGSGTGPGRSPREQIDQAERLVREAKELLYHAWDGQPVFPVGHQQTLLGSAVSRLESALMDLGKLGRPPIGFTLPDNDRPPASPSPVGEGPTPGPAATVVHQQGSGRAGRAAGSQLAAPAVDGEAGSGPASLDPAEGSAAVFVPGLGRWLPAREVAAAFAAYDALPHDPDPVPPRPRPSPGADEDGAW